MKKVLDPVKPGPNPCLNCPDPKDVLDLTGGGRIAVGFGDAHLSRDGKIVASETNGADWDDCLSFKDAEKMAAKDPDHDWRIVLNGPLHGETYQRQGTGKWVCVESNQGFA